MNIRDRDLVPNKVKGISRKAWILSLFPAILFAVGIRELVHRVWFFPLKVNTTEFEPSIPQGDSVVVNRFYDLQKLAPGTILLIHYPGSEDNYMLRRLIGKPGDMVQIQDGSVIVNGKEIQIWPPPSNVVMATIDPKDNAGPFQLGAHEIFVLCASRDQTLDSRRFGPIDSDLVVGTIDEKSDE